MARSILFWILAILFTFSMSLYQRMTGPTHALRGTAAIAGTEIPYRLARSHGGDDNHQVRIDPGDAPIEGRVEWKRFKTRDEWVKVAMTRVDGVLVAELPHQPPGGKLIYRVFLASGPETTPLPEEPAIIRFRNAIPWFVLIPHVLAMFGALLLSTRTGLEFFSRDPRVVKLTWWTIGMLILGGGILGPILQKIAFGDYWTGWPHGTDLTDNKTLVALLVWIGALVVIKRMKPRKPAAWTLAASILTLVVYAIPHSVLGSELDYETGKMRNIGAAPCPQHGRHIL